MARPVGVKNNHPRSDKGKPQIHNRIDPTRVLTVSERSRRYRECHPEKYTAEARRERRRPSEARYRLTPQAKEAHRRYVLSGKKKLTDANGHLKHRYGKTLKEKTSQWELQKGQCDLCGLSLSDVLTSHWDHDHATGRMRGLLHRRCNWMLGFLENGLHEAAMAYLRRYRDGGINS